MTILQKQGYVVSAFSRVKVNTIKTFYGPHDLSKTWFYPLPWVKGSSRGGSSKKPRTVAGLGGGGPVAPLGCVATWLAAVPLA